MSKFLISFAACIAFFSSVNAFALAPYLGGAELLNAKAYSIAVESSVFNTTGHFDYTGAKFPLSSDSSYRLIDADLKISYGISSNLQLSAFGKGRSVKSIKEGFSANNSGPESAGVEAKYAFAPINSLVYAVGIRYRKTLYTNTTYINKQIPPKDQVILGDDGSEYGVDFYGTYNSRPWKFDFLVGYNSPPNSLSSEMIYKAEAFYRFGGIGLFTGLEGIKSLNRDQYTDTPTLKPLMSVGESLLFNSLNREKMAPYIGANYAFNKVLVTLKGQTVISGHSTDKGNSILLGMSWGSTGVTAESQKIDSFKEYHIDGSVLKVSARGNFIKIDQGLSTDVEKGGKFDIYQTDYFGGNELVGSGVVYELGADWSVIKLVKKYKEIEIKPGFAARGY